MMKISVTVKPNSKQPGIEDGPEGLIVKLSSPPVDGKANEELIKVIAKKYGVIRSAVSIRSGGSGRKKIIEIKGI